MYHYFVSFAYSKGNKTAFGHCTVVRNKPITTIKAINYIAKKISQQSKPFFKDVIILNYQLLRKEPDAE